MSDVDAPAADDEQRRLRLLLGVLAGVVLLALLWFFVVTPLFLAGDAGEDTTARPPAADQPTEPPVETETEAEEVDPLLALPIETYEIFLARDPFDPVVPETAAFDGADGDAPTGGTDGQAGGGGTTGDDGTSGDGTNGDGADGVQHNAALVDVFVDDSGTPRAVIRVDDLVYTVGEGDEFADGYRVVAIQGSCVTLSYQEQLFTLCEGGGGTDGDGGAGDGGTDGANGGQAGTDGCSGNGEVVCDGRVVTLVDVYTDTDGDPVAVVQVDSTLYEVRRGDTFAQNFRVISVDPPCVTLLYGDDAFTLCEGERTMK